MCKLGVGVVCLVRYPVSSIYGLMHNKPGYIDTHTVPAGMYQPA